MQKGELFEELLKLPSSIIEAISKTLIKPFTDLIKIILKSERLTATGKINLTMCILLSIVLIMQSFKTIFCQTEYNSILCFFCLFVFSTMMSERQMRKKEGREILSGLIELLDEFKD